MPSPQPPSAASSSPAPLELRRIRELTRSRHYLDALALAEAAPENSDMLYLIAINQRCLNRIDAALATLHRLEQRQPRFSRLYQERGHCYMAVRDAPRAIDAFRRAVDLNPALPPSWSMLERLYSMTGDPRNAATAAEHLAALQRLPPEIVQAAGLLSDGELAVAENVVRAYLRQSGEHVEALHLLARILIARGVLDDAEQQLEAVLRLAPDDRAARYDHARVLVDRQKYQGARTAIDTLLALEPDNAVYRALDAAARVGLGEYETAITIYRQLIAEAPDAAELHLSLAHPLKAIGRRADSIQACHAAAAARPGFGDAYWSLANLKTYRFTADEITRMREAEAAPEVTRVDRYHLCFALGRALEDRRDYADSWDHYMRGNALKRAERPYRADLVEADTDRQVALCTRDFFASRMGSGAPNPDPIFIVGLPRSGSTLLEQILASHSRVEGTQELAEIPRIARDVQGRELGVEDLRRLGEAYLHDTRVYRAGKPFFIDKMPNNFRHIGLIHRILPNAKIIDARREPMACCVSNLKQLFAGGQEFTYGIADIAHYYRTYLDLMRHWDQTLPGRVLRVWHEDVVEDLAGSVRRLLDFCGLEFEPECLEFHRTERSVRTASSEQVRQPIFRTGLDQWRHYEPWLDPLKAALGDAVVRCG